MTQAVALQDITTTLLVCTHKQSFELISNAQRENFQYNSKNIKYQSGCIDSFGTVLHRRANKKLTALTQLAGSICDLLSIENSPIAASSFFEC